MTQYDLQITVRGTTSTVPLRPGLTRVGATGGRGVDVGIDGAAGELHVWDDPPKVVRVQGEDALIVSGSMLEESMLQDGTEFAWCGAKFQLLAPAPVLEEITSSPAVESSPTPLGAAMPAPTGGGSGATAVRDLGAVSGMAAEESRAWARMSAGLLVETGLADKKAVKRWQAAVVQNEWDADACARDILGASAGERSHPRFVERAGRLERDLLMASFQRGIKGASRRARGAARSTTAFFLANVIAILCYSAIILALLILGRVKYDLSLDGTIDRMVDAVTPGLLCDFHSDFHSDPHREVHADTTSLRR